MNLIIKAKKFAEKAHKGQLRKYTNEPYINHPISVARLVQTVCNDEYVLMAALLHDVVEYTETTIDDIWREFGGKVADIVSDLTDISKPEDGNRKIRKEIDRQHIAKACKEAKLIKLADLIDNHKSIEKYDPDFAKVYMAEFLRLLDVLERANDELFNQAQSILKEDINENIIL